MYRSIIAALVLFLLFAYPAAVVGEEVSSSRLIDQAKALDMQDVIYSGEVIGDILNAGDHVWLNVSDGSNAIGIWTQSGLASDIQVAGRYSQQGDSIRVSGTFHRACPEHGGDMDLHADTITLIAHGHPVSHDVPAWKVWLAVFLTIAAVACMANLLLRIAGKSPVRYRL
jgi:hypothetical protein